VTAIMVLSALDKLIFPPLPLTRLVVRSFLLYATTCSRSSLKSIIHLILHAIKIHLDKKYVTIHPMQYILGAQNDYSAIIAVISIRNIKENQ
jgi:hypothetical protein